MVGRLGDVRAHGPCAEGIKRCVDPLVSLIPSFLHFFLSSFPPPFIFRHLLPPYSRHPLILLSSSPCVPLTVSSLLPAFLRRLFRPPHRDFFSYANCLFFGTLSLHSLCYSFLLCAAKCRLFTFTFLLLRCLQHPDG